MAYISATATVLATIFLACLLVLVIRFLFHVDEKELTSSAVKLFEEKYRFAVWPKPVERLVYLLLLFFVPAVLVSIYSFAALGMRRISTDLLRSVYWVAAVVGPLLLVVLIYFDFKLDPSNFLLREPVNYYDDTRRFVSQLLSKHLVQSLLALPLLLYLLFLSTDGVLRRTTNVVLSMAIVVAIAGLFVIDLFSRDSYPGWYENFNAAFYAVSQVVNGSSILVDFTNQYGLYPQFLEPIFRVTGLNAATYSFVMAVLVALSYVFLFVFMKQNIVNKILLLLGFLVLVHLRTFFVSFFTEYDAYFQYTPIRFVFPCLLLFVASLYFRRPRKVTYFFGYLVGSVSVLWNLDTGLFVFLTWIITMVYLELFNFEIKRFLLKSIQHIFVGILILGLVIGVYCVWVLVRSGQLPDLGRFLRYQNIFYFTGFYMMNTPVFNAWNVVVLLYGLGLISSIRAVFGNDSSGTSKAVFLLSILGIGLFTYYQGRSHDYVLFAVCYPAVVLLMIFLDRILGRSRSVGPVKTLLNPFFLVGISISALLLCHFLDFDRLKGIAAHGLSGFFATEQPNKTLTKDLAFLGENSKRGEKVVILSEPGFLDGIYFAESGTRNAIDVPGSSELVLLEDYQRVVDFVKSNKTIKVFANVGYKDRVIRPLLDSLYAKQSSDGNLELFLPR